MQNAFDFLHIDFLLGSLSKATLLEQDETVKVIAMRALATLLFVVLLPIVLLVGIETIKNISQLSSDGPGRDAALANVLLFIVALVLAAKSFEHSCFGSKGKQPTS